MWQRNGERSIMKVLNQRRSLWISFTVAPFWVQAAAEALTKGIEFIDLAISKGKTFKLASFDELEAEDIVVCPYSCGAISPLSEEERKKYEGLPVYEDTYISRRLKTWKRIWESRSRL